MRNWAPRRCVQGYLDARRYRATDALALRIHDVERRGRAAEVDHDRRPAVPFGCGEGVDDAVGPDLSRVVGEDRDSGADTWLDDHARCAGEGSHEHGPPGLEHRWDGRADGYPGDLVLMLAEQPAEEDCPLVGGAALDGGHQPVGRHLAVADQAQHGVAVADVGGEKGASGPFEATHFRFST
jgi:hypothetical protein